MLKRWLVLAAIGIAFGMTNAQPVGANDAPRQQLAEQTCSALKQSAAAIPGNGPMILPSYPDMQGDARMARFYWLGRLDVFKQYVEAFNGDAEE